MMDPDKSPIHTGIERLGIAREETLTKIEAVNIELREQTDSLIQFCEDAIGTVVELGGISTQYLAKDHSVRSYDDLQDGIIAKEVPFNAYRIMGTSLSDEPEFEGGVVPQRILVEDIFGTIPEEQALFYIEVNNESPRFTKPSDSSLSPET